MSLPDEVEAALEVAAASDVEDRVALFNELVRRAAHVLLHDLPPDPATRPQLIRSDRVRANDYNPNRVAKPELDLLEESMRADGITMAVVVVADEAGGGVVVDGFHRRTVGTERLGRKYLPCAVIDSTMADRMASTVRHNRARGKHDVELMGHLVRGMTELAWDDERIATSLGMSVEELLRLKQTVGAARLLAAKEYARAWGGRDGSDHPG